MEDQQIESNGGESGSDNLLYQYLGFDIRNDELCDYSSSKSFD